MAKHPVFPMWIQDYLADTSHLDATEHGVYHLLLYRYWLMDGKALPEDIAVLRRIARCRTRRTVERILTEFWQLSTGEGWHHKRARIELRVTRDRKVAASESAKKRWEIKDPAYANAFNPQCSPTPTPKEREEREEKNPPIVPPTQLEKPKPKPKPKSQPAAVPLPVVEGLDKQAWEEYEEYRRQAKMKKLKPPSVLKNQRWLAQQPDQAAVVDQTIRNGWTGLFELKTREPRTKDEYEAEQRARLERGAPGEVLEGDGESVWPAMVLGPRQRH